MIKYFSPVSTKAINEIANIAELGLYVKTAMILNIVNRNPCRAETASKT